MGFEDSIKHMIDDFYQIFVFPYYPTEDENEKVIIELLDLNNVKIATMSMIDDMKDNSEYYFRYEKWLRKHKLKNILNHE